MDQYFRCFVSVSNTKGLLTTPTLKNDNALVGMASSFFFFFFFFWTDLTGPLRLNTKRNSTVSRRSIQSCPRPQKYSDMTKCKNAWLGCIYLYKDNCFMFSSCFFFFSLFFNWTFPSTNSAGSVESCGRI